MWTGCCSSISAVRLELAPRLVRAPGAAALNGEAQQLLAVRRRPDKLVLTDKAQQLWSTKLRNTNANMLPWCSSIMFTTEIWLNSASRANLTKSDLRCLSARALLMAKMGNVNDCGFYQHGDFKCPDVLLDPFWRSWLLLQVTWLVLPVSLAPASNCLLAASWSCRMLPCSGLPWSLVLLEHWSLERFGGPSQSRGVGWSEDVSKAFWL